MIEIHHERNGFRVIEDGCSLSYSKKETSKYLYSLGFAKPNYPVPAIKDNHIEPLWLYLDDLLGDYDEWYHRQAET